jgi:hypothetical protein
MGPRRSVMKRRSGPCGYGCRGVSILRLNGTPFGSPVLALERPDLQQLFVVLDLVLGVQPALADNIVICLEDVNKSCRGGRCTTYNSIEKFDLVRGESRKFGY